MLEESKASSRTRWKACHFVWLSQKKVLGVGQSKIKNWQDIMLLSLLRKVMTHIIQDSERLKNTRPEMAYIAGLWCTVKQVVHHIQDHFQTVHYLVIALTHELADFKKAFTHIPYVKLYSTAVCFANFYGKWLLFFPIQNVKLQKTTCSCYWLRYHKHIAEKIKAIFCCWTWTIYNRKLQSLSASTTWKTRYLFYLQILVGPLTK